MSRRRIAGPPEEASAVGRTAELEALGQVVRGADAGDGGVAWLLGEGGIGKSLLAAAAVREARARGMTVAAAAADELERHRPFGVLADALGIARAGGDERREAVARLLATDAVLAVEADGSVPRGGGELAFAIGEALLGVLEDRSTERPALLVLEDLHWADAQSLELLGRLATRAADLRLAVVCTARTAPRRAAVEQAIARCRERGARVLELGPLDAEAAEALAAASVGAPLGPGLRDRVAACGGNPLFIGVLLDALAGDGAIVRDADGRAELATSAPPVPPTLAQTILDRLRALPATTTELLGLASVLGTELAVADAAALTGRPAAALWPALREALAAGVLVEDGDRLRFAHDVVREALYDDLPRPVRASLHLEAGRALAAAGADAIAVAEHLLRGAGRGDRDALAWLERAAREASARSAAVAAELLEAALALADRDDPARGRLEAELAVTLVAAGRRPEGERLAREVLAAGAHPPSEGTLRLALARSLVERGRFAEAFEEAALAAASPGVGARDRAEALAYGTVAPLMNYRLEEAAAETERVQGLAEEAGAPHVVALMLGRRAHVAGFRGDFGAAARLTAEAVDVVLAADTREAHHTSHAHLNHALALADADRPEEGVATIAAARRIYERLGMEETLRNSHHYAGYPLMLAGRWDDALTELETATTLSEEAGITWTADVLATRAMIHVRRGEVETARALLDAADEQLAAGAPLFRRGWVTWVHGLVAEADGDRDAGLEALWRAWTEVGEGGAPGEQRTFADDLARMLAQAGDTRRGAAVADAAEALARRNPEVASIAALARRCRALVDGDADALAAAAAAHPLKARPYERALAHEDAAEALVAAGRLADARRLADVALDGYERLGARQDAARAEARLRARGLRRGRRGPRTRAADGWEALTPTERRVAELAADGLSNPQIAERLVVSRHTVATHVSHVLAKLGLRSRHQLAAARPAGEPPA